MEETRSEPTSDLGSRWGPVWMGWLGLPLLWALLYLPNAGAEEWHHEEARRAVPAREMLASDNWVKPTLFGRAYLNKPPGYMWAVAAVSGSPEGVDEWSVRWPALIGTLLGALIAAAIAARAFSSRAGPWAGLLYLLTWSVFEKGGLGEIEGLFGPMVLAAVGLLWWAPRSFAAAFGSGLALGVALLLKGPPALLFAGAGYGALFFTHPRAVWKQVKTYLPLLLGVLPIGVWTLMLLQQVPWAEVFGRWGGELAREGDGGLAQYGKDRMTFVAGVLLGFFPASWMVLGSIPKLRESEHRNATRFFAWSAAIALVAFALPVGTRPRYAYPAIGLVTILAASVIPELRMRGMRFRSLRGWLPVGWVCGILGVAIFATAALAGIWDPLNAGTPKAIAWVFAVLAGASGFYCLRMSTSGLSRDFLPFALLALAAGRAYQMLHIVPAEATERENQAQAEFVEAARAEGRAVWTRAPGQFNGQAYLSPPPRWLTAEDKPQPGDILLLLPGEPDPFPLGIEWDQLIDSDEQMNRLRVLRKTGP